MNGLSCVYVAKIEKKKDRVAIKDKKRADEMMNGPGWQIAQVGSSVKNTFSFRSICPLAPITGNPYHHHLYHHELSQLVFTIIIFQAQQHSAVPADQNQLAIVSPPALEFFSRLGFQSKKIGVWQSSFSDIAC